MWVWRLGLGLGEGRTVVAGFAARAEDQVVSDLVAAAKAVVGVDAGSRAVEEDVAEDDRLRGLGLDEERGLATNATN